MAKIRGPNPLAAISRETIKDQRVSWLSSTTTKSNQIHHWKMTDEHDKLLPIANIGRIMKQILPPNAKVSREAKERMQECASEFISFVTGEASDRCHKDNRKTVNGDDLCWALSSLGFDYYYEAMSRYLHKLREFQMRKAAAQGYDNCKKANKDSSSEERDNEATGIEGNPGNRASDNWIDFGILEKRGTQ